MAVQKFNFFEISSRWWFFPVLFLILAIMTGKFYPLSLSTLAMIPLGYAFLTPKAGWDAMIFYVIGFYVLFISAIIILSYYKIRKNKILKWLVVALYFYILIPIIVFNVSVTFFDGFDFFF